MSLGEGSNDQEPRLHSVALLPAHQATLHFPANSEAASLCPAGGEVRNRFCPLVGEWL